MHHVHILNCPFNEILFSFHLTLRSRLLVRNKDKTKQEKQKQRSKTQHIKKKSQLPQRASLFRKKKIRVILISLVTEKRFLEWAVNVLKNWKVPELENMNLRTNPHKKRPLL